MIETIRKVRRVKNSGKNGVVYTSYTINLPTSFVLAIGVPEKVRVRLDLKNKKIILEPYIPDNNMKVD